MTARPSNSDVLKATVGGLQTYLLFRIWRKYGKGALGLAYLIGFCAATQASWDQLEEVWNKLQEELRAIREARESAAADLAKLEEFTQSRSFSTPRNKE